MPSLARARVPSLLVVAALGLACGGDDGESGTTTIVADVGATEGGLVDVEDVSCGRNGDQLVARGIVRNRGDNPHYVSIAVRFVDGDGVRVELTSDSVNDLVTSESARWDVNVFTEDADSVVACEIAAEAT